MAIDLQHCREHYERGAWSEAYEWFRAADQTVPLDADDLQRLGISAYLIGREIEFEHCFDRVYRAQLDKGAHEHAARATFWLALSLLLRGELAQSNAWIARGQRLIHGRDCVEHGYLMGMAAERHLQEGRAEAARATAASAAAIGQRFGDPDLIAMSRHDEARALIQQNRVIDAFDVLDEMMLAVIAGELSPIVTGLMYCSVIDVCRQMSALRRAREWTCALARWWERHSEPVAFSGTCLAYRAEVLRFQGAWPDALADARQACERATRANRKPPGAALYQQAEIHRVRGEHTRAEEKYRAASDRGYDPQPGLALLRLAEGQLAAASAAMRRAVGATTDGCQRARLLPAYVEVMLAAGDIERAREACRELRDLSDTFHSDALRAAAAQAQGAIAIAEGDAHAALAPLRRAFDLWTALDAPYEAARVRVLIGRACHVLADDETAALEFTAARTIFGQLAARTDLIHLDLAEHSATSRTSSSTIASKLSRRELDVLRLIAAGRTNKTIAVELQVSERTVDRHVSNILCKLDVPTRAAATAHAYQHKLL